MQESDALALVAVLQAAFPSFTGGEPTARLFATKLRTLDAATAAAGINHLVDHRENTAWPSWAEVAHAIHDAQPRHHELAPPDPEPLDPTLIHRLVARAMPNRIPPPDPPGSVEAKIARAKAALKETNIG